MTLAQSLVAILAAALIPNLVFFVSRDLLADGEPLGPGSQAALLGGALLVLFVAASAAIASGRGDGLAWTMALLCMFAAAFEFTYFTAALLLARLQFRNPPAV